jgi:RepB DNA-primase from phage plasmid
MSTPEQIHNLKPTPTDARHGGQDPSFQSEPASTHLRVIALEGGVVFVGPLSRARPFELPGDLEAALAHASSVVMAGDDCYVTPGLFARDDQGHVERNADHAAGARVAWCDVDGWDDEREKTYERLLVTLGGDAVFRLQTSPGRYHVYVCLTEVISPKDVKVINQRLVAAFDGDPAPMHAAAWMRLAGTVHQPKPKDADDPVRNVATPILFAEGPGDGVVTVEEFHRALDRLRLRSPWVRAGAQLP